MAERGSKLTCKHLHKIFKRCERVSIQNFTYMTYINDLDVEIQSLLELSNLLETDRLNLNTENNVANKLK